jgi:NAD dependent epimerase/dehydratase family enzyme
MRILITGGTGLIGGALADNLARDGHEAILLSRNPRPEMRSHPGIREEKWDGRTTQGWGHLADGADAIVNLAGVNLSSGRWTVKRKKEVLGRSRPGDPASCQQTQACDPILGSWLLWSQ